MEKLLSIKQYLDKHQISQRDLAKMCKLPQSSIARIESHKTIPKLDTLIKIMQPLGLTLTVSK